jgi:hypothetical protein
MGDATSGPGGEAKGGLDEKGDRIVDYLGQERLMILGKGM